MAVDQVSWAAPKCTLGLGQAFSATVGFYKALIL
jgi:hypothetical protein